MIMLGQLPLFVWFLVYINSYTLQYVLQYVVRQKLFTVYMSCILVPWLIRQIPYKNNIIFNYDISVL